MVSAMLEKLFRIRQHGSAVQTEILGGLTTFMTMSYIVFVNPAVLSQTGMDFGAVLTATCLAAGIGTWAMGLAANYPIALAPGMGENFFFLTAVVGMGLSWEVALAAVFASGILFVLLNFLRLRELVIDAVPDALKHGIAVGIGLFITVMGLVGAGLVERSDTGGLLRLGEITRAPTLVALAGILVTVSLLARRVQGAVLFGIATSSILAWSLGLTRWQGLVAAPPSLAPTFLKLDLAGLLDLALVPVVIIFLFMAVFDAIGTLIGVGDQAGLLRDGRLPRATPALLADSSATVAGSLLGTSTVTAFVESATGVGVGARTGLANMVTGALFFLTLFFSPVIRMIGAGVPLADGTTLNPMTAPALVVVGCLMARNIRRIDWIDLTEAFPAFLIVIGIPFSWSVADGIALGFIAYPAIKLLAGRGREASPLMYGLGLLFALRYLFL
jgi:AGZA family xanthine/uracil permease-like MFS transporter